MTPRLIEQSADARMFERDSRALRIMLIIRVRELPSSSDLLPLRRQRRDLRKRPLAFRGEDVGDHKRW